MILVRGKTGTVDVLQQPGTMESDIGNTKEFTETLKDRKPWLDGNLESYYANTDGIKVVPTDSYFLVSVFHQTTTATPGFVSLLDGDSGGVVKFSTATQQYTTHPHYLGDAPIEFETDVYLDVDTTGDKIMITGYDG